MLTNWMLLRKRYARATTKKKWRAIETGFRISREYIRWYRHWCYSFFPFHSFYGMCAWCGYIYFSSFVVFFPFIMNIHICTNNVQNEMSIWPPFNSTKVDIDVYKFRSMQSIPKKKLELYLIDLLISIGLCRFACNSIKWMNDSRTTNRNA